MKEIKFTLKYKSLLALLIIIPFFVSCSGGKNIMYQEGLQKNVYSESFTIVPIKNQWIYNDYDVSLSEYQEDLITQSLPSSIAKVTPNRFELFEQDSEIPYGEFQSQKLPFSGSGLDINFPSADVLKKFPTRYVFFLQDFQFSVIARAPSNGQYAGHESPGYKVLQFESKFYIWDNEKEAAVTWGEVRKESRIGNRVTAEDYERVLTAFSDDVIGESPIRSRAPVIQ